MQISNRIVISNLPNIKMRSASFKNSDAVVSIIHSSPSAQICHSECIETVGVISLLVLFDHVLGVTEDTKQCGYIKKIRIDS